MAFIMIENLELHHLRTLNALFDTHSITSAAESLNISQQAVSLKLNKMREILGDPLFIREGHGMVPTTYALELQPHIETILVHLSQLPRPGGKPVDNTERTLVISATDYTQQILLQPLFGELRQRFPHAKLMITNIESSSLTKRMSHGEIQLAFTSAGYVPEGLISIPLFSESYRCVTGNASLASQAPLSLAELENYPFVVTNPGTAILSGSADHWLARQGITRHVVASAPSFDRAMQMIKSTDVIGFIPSRLLPCEGLYEMPLSKYPPGYQVVVAHHPNTLNDPLVNWVIEAVKQLV
ncbi:transcriptional regulator [Marinobacterium zhoushanense]|uniref:Transcriptional regulator n=1 Tax=Marinobacterium zhoushanense TaxID=1679163 RepID=A0ABQ1KVZ2_9GAMM|nr:transcriptional regulator [Marinobacterium zhoushanense]